MEREYTTSIRENMNTDITCFYNDVMYQLLMYYSKLLSNVIVVDLYTNQSFHTCTLILGNNFLSFEVKNEYAIVKINSFKYIIHSMIDNLDRDVLIETVFKGGYSILTAKDSSNKIGSIELKWNQDSLSKYNRIEKIALKNVPNTITKIDLGIIYIK